jgi:hypothetical protein
MCEVCKSSAIVIAIGRSQIKRGGAAVGEGIIEKAGR